MATGVCAVALVDVVNNPIDVVNNPTMAIVSANRSAPGILGNLLTTNNQSTPPPQHSNYRAAMRRLNLAILSSIWPSNRTVSNQKSLEM